MTGVQRAKKERVARKALARSRRNTEARKATTAQRRRVAARCAAARAKQPLSMAQKRREDWLREQGSSQ